MNPNPASTTSSNYITLDLIRLILINELGIDPDRVVIYNQKFIIPKHSGLFIYLETKGSKTISSRNVFVNVDTSDANEEQDVNTVEDVVVGLYSKNLEALQRKEEAIGALHSLFSQNLQETQSFKIFRNVNVFPLNEVEGATRLYRSDLEFKVMAWYNKVKVAQFLNQYGVEVVVNEKPDFDVKFTIPATDPTQKPFN